MTGILHYVHDPLCGWCYGAEPLVRAAESVHGLAIELHVGGLWPGPTRLPAETLRHIRQADERIAAMTGQPFGAAYHDGLMLDPTMVLDSGPPTAAVLAAASIDAGKTLSMLRAVQHGHYEQGRRVVERDVLCDIAVECGLDRAAFAAALDDAPVNAHIAATRGLMARLGAQGFPTFALETGGEWLGVPHQRFASSPRGFAEWLEAALSSQSTRAAEG